MSNAFTHSKIELHVLGDGWGGASGLPPQAAATLTELRFPSPGLRAKHATLGINPTNHSYSVRVAISLRRYSQLIFYRFTKE